MAKNLSLLKPDVRTKVIKEVVMEKSVIVDKAVYLDIPKDISIKELKNDINLGAVHFKEVLELAEKEKAPKYILITTDNQEQGYMAVSYLAAAYNRAGKLEYDEFDNIEDYDDEWVESPWRIPIIEESALRQNFDDSNSQFTMGNMFMQGNEAVFRGKAWWYDCTRESVCIVSGGNQMEYGFGGMSNKAILSEALEHFGMNKRVYIINVDPKVNVQYDVDEEDIFDFYDCTREKWNNIVLNFVADEVTVSLPSEDADKYYKVLLKSIFQKKGIKVQKGFQSDKVVKLVVSMFEKDKCKLMETIVNYAIKDWNEDNRLITNNDFEFMKRFVGAKAIEKDNKENNTARDKIENSLIGLERVKEQVFDIVNVMKFNKLRAQMNINGSSYHNVHLMLGAPGTAKTTVAKLMGQLMVEEKLLPDNRFVCVNGAELKGMYVGHSAPKTKALFEENDIIVIDEAYSLVGDHGENDSFSKEAIAQLIIEIEEHSMDKLVIFAGYGGRKVNEKNNKMKEFLDSNPGIKSRITSTIYFDSYTPDNMVDIFFRIAKNQHYIVDDSAKKNLKEYFEKRVEDDNFGNGREARSLLETAVIYMAKRIFKQNKTNYTKNELKVVTLDDVAQAIAYMEEANAVQEVCRKNRGIGFVF